MAVSGNSPVSGTPVVMNPCENGSAGQLWQAPMAASANGVRAHMVTVSSTKFATAAGVWASAGQVFTIKANGTVDLSSQNGSYIVDANGTIVVAPPPGSGAYRFFTNFAGPAGAAPLVGSKKLPIPPNDVAYLANGPYGTLVAGFSSNPEPRAVSDFPSGFTLIGASGSITAPFSGLLFFAVNDSALGDNTGSFTLSVASSTPPR